MQDFCFSSFFSEALAIQYSNGRELSESMWHCFNFFEQYRFIEIYLKKTHKNVRKKHKSTQTVPQNPILKC